MNKKVSTQKVTLIAILIAISVIFSILDSIISSSLQIVVLIPYFKIGLANIVIIIAIYRLEYVYLLLLVFMKAIIVKFLLGNPYGFMITLIPSFISANVMYLLVKKSSFNIVTISVVGSFIHNIIQLITVYFFTKMTGVFTYLPLVIFIGVLSGILVGVLASKAVSTLSKIFAFDE